MTKQQKTAVNMAKFIQNQSLLLLEKLNELDLGVLGIFRPKTTKCSGGRAVRGLQRGITFR